MFAKVFAGVSLTRVKRVIVLGAGGRLGAALLREYSRDHSVRGYTHAQLDLKNADRLRQELSMEEFEVLINAAALTNVDYCETNRDEAFAINATAPKVLAELCREKGKQFVHISTDYVFDGGKDKPYHEDDRADPLSVYGDSKRAGEAETLAANPQAFIARVSWVFGPDRASFVDNVLTRAREHEEVAAVADKFSAPTYTLDLANWLRQAIEKQLAGLFHLANAGECSWQEYAQYALDCCHQHGVKMRATKVEALKLDEMKNFIARRPAYTVLATEKFRAATGAEIRDWRAAVEDYLIAFYRLPLGLGR